MTKCPKCGSDLWFDEVDIGVGILKGNFSCQECGWVQEDQFADLINVG